VRKAKVNDEVVEEESPEDVNRTKDGNKYGNNLAASEKNINDATIILYRKCKQAKEHAIEILLLKETIWMKATF